MAYFEPFTRAPNVWNYQCLLEANQVTNDSLQGVEENSQNTINSFSKKEILNLEAYHGLMSAAHIL